jgi:hypothetical protein
MTSAYRLIGLSAYRLWCLFPISIGLLIGCDWDRSVAQFAVDSQRGNFSSSGNSLVIDAGIVLLDREGYLCVPLQRLGISPSSELASVTSSCPCMEAEFINYAIGKRDSARAVLLKFKRDSPGEVESVDGRMARNAGEVSSKVEIKLANGDTLPFYVSILHSSQVGGGAP